MARYDEENVPMKAVRETLACRVERLEERVEILFKSRDLHAETLEGNDQILSDLMREVGL